MHGLLALAVHRCPPGHDPASGSGYMLVLEDVTTFSDCERQKQILCNALDESL
jgi:hypothetical protein